MKKYIKHLVLLSVVLTAIGFWVERSFRPWGERTTTYRKFEKTYRRMLFLPPYFDENDYPDRYMPWAKRMVADFQRTVRHIGCKPENLGLYTSELFKALFSIDGICGPQDYKQAYSLLREGLYRSFQSRDEAPIWALLGELYWHGRGVPQDREKSVAMFKQAFMASSELFLLPAETYIWASHFSSYWGPSEIALKKQFFHVALGPRDWPPSYGEAKAWFESLDGESAYQAALDLRNGRNGFDPDPGLAYHWMWTVNRKFKYAPALFEGFKWTRDESFVRDSFKPYYKMKKYSKELMARGYLDYHEIDLRSKGNKWLVAAARAGVKEAIPYIYCLHDREIKTKQDEIFSTLRRINWLLLAKREKLLKSEDTLSQHIRHFHKIGSELDKDFWDGMLEKDVQYISSGGSLDTAFLTWEAWDIAECLNSTFRR